ncbi:MAG: TonB-dependent receptor, partial [Bacteroidaceae bacterium]|nr:TonB-dependent receptor [Bacteroidaceae bacterium]
MSKGVKMMALACCISAGAMAQTAVDTLQTQSDEFDFTFSEAQLDEDNDAAQTVSSIVAAKDDYFLSEVGYRFSPMRYRVRAYDNKYSQTLMNGVVLNDAERGSFSYGMIGGMNDAVRNQEGVAEFGYNNFTLPGIGGATSINTRASQFAEGSKLALSGTNRNYVARGMFTYATGLMPSGWALAGSVGYRWAKEGVIEGTFYNSFSY